MKAGHGQGYGESSQVSMRCLCTDTHQVALKDTCRQGVSQNHTKQKRLTATYEGGGSGKQYVRMCAFGRIAWKAVSAGLLM